ncbi:dTMP kinase [Ligilactobacillus sp. WILCCON 0076]|uniref:Thymidylate kinase n=1 Tax=Ligilactobacillus ubinensis TaxID=2876789 RepID=A0A9X2FJ00_9LACO|nr:dTMP kinase [Ligilactobacillus ubinensis]MCP0886385.1 dTMP kinase [Ligilactobacillus ubinensis]
MNGFFLSFEGTDGSGKTSVLRKIVQKLAENGNKDNFILTREPGGNRIAEAIRDVILNVDFTEMDAKTEALLYAASRRQHLVETILPALKANKLVLCDRFVDSSLVYQGKGRNIGMQKIDKLNQFVTDGIEPDLTIFFDVNPKIGLERIATSRTDEVNRLDQENMKFYEDIHQAYLSLVAANKHRIVRIDASQSLTKVTDDVIAVLEQRIPHFFPVEN